MARSACWSTNRPPAGHCPPTGTSAKAETIHIVDGEFEMDVDGHRSRVTAGGTIHIPRGVVHAGANIGHQPGRRIVAFSPAGFQRFFLEIGASTPDAGVETAAAVASASRHGWEFISDRRPS